MKKTFILLVSFLVLSHMSTAVIVQVDWFVDIPELDAPNPGPGNLSGSLGVFTVFVAGQSFLLPSDGSLTAIASGFDESEFRNGLYSFTRTFSSGAPELKFLSIGDNPEDFSVDMVEGNLGLLSEMEAFTVGDISGHIAVSLFNQYEGAVDKASAIFSIDGSTKPSFPITYSFTVIPEPATITLLTLGVFLAGRRRKS
jgi:hypothetical protein